MEPIDYLRIFRRRWGIILLCLTIGLGAAWSTTPARPKVGPVIHSYRAAITLIQDPSSTTELNLASTRFLVTVGSIPRIAAGILRYKGDPALLATSVSASIDDHVGALTISTSGPDGVRDAAVANAFGQATITYLQQAAQRQAHAAVLRLQPQLDQLATQISQLSKRIGTSSLPSIYTAQRDALVSRYSSLYQSFQTAVGQQIAGPPLTVLQRATPIPVISGGGTFSPPKSRSGRLLVAAVLALLLGCGLVLALERIDTRLRLRSSFESAFRLPVVAEVPRLTRSQRRSPLVVTTMPGSGAAEAFRALRSALLLMPGKLLSADPMSASERVRRRRRWRATTSSEVGQAPQVVLVTSARPGAGKTTAIANLAAALAETGKSVVLLDFDLRRPGIAALLDVPTGRGLAELLAGPTDIPLTSVVRPSKLPQVRVATGGAAVAYPAALLASAGSRIDEACELADFVLIDAPPLLSANDALDLIPHVDSVIVVARSGRTTQDQARRATELLARMHVPIIGLTLVASPEAMRVAPYDDLYAPVAGAPGRHRRGTAAAGESVASTTVAEEPQP
ncbi:MAG: P-loop NTPase [Mycobacteriales bacterium]